MGGESYCTVGLVRAIELKGEECRREGVEIKFLLTKQPNVVCITSLRP